MLIQQVYGSEKTVLYSTLQRAKQLLSFYATHQESRDAQQAQHLEAGIRVGGVDVAGMIGGHVVGSETEQLQGEADQKQRAPDERADRENQFQFVHGESPAKTIGNRISLCKRERGLPELRRRFPKF